MPDAPVTRAEVRAAAAHLRDELDQGAHDNHHEVSVLLRLAEAVLAALDSPASDNTARIVTGLLGVGVTLDAWTARVYRRAERHTLARIVADEKGGTDG